MGDWRLNTTGSPDEQEPTDDREVVEVSDEENGGKCRVSFFIFAKKNTC